MIDLRAARADPDAMRAALARKGAGEAFDRLMDADSRWRELVPQVDELRSRTKLKGKPTDEQRAELQRVKAELKEAEDALAAAERERDAALLEVPNPPDDDVPDGDSEDDAVELRRVGEPRQGEAKEAAEIGRFELERAARLSGSRFGYLVGDTALLALALYRFAIDHVSRAGFTPVLPPVLVREEAMVGTGFFPTERSNIYGLEGEGLYLTGTSEVALAGMHMGEILEDDVLPIRYAGFSTCFRREAGAAGKDTRGIMRVHQFDKVEMVLFERPEDSAAALEWMTERAEILLQRLGLAYRVLLMSTREMGFTQARKYDLEVWSPGVERWLEVSSCSNFRDFQARRMAIRYRPEPGAKPELVHTLNGSGLALARVVAALLETYQRPDGSIEVPGVLRPYLGRDEIARD